MAYFKQRDYKSLKRHYLNSKQWRPLVCTVCQKYTKSILFKTFSSIWYIIFNVLQQMFCLKGGEVAQWLGRRISDQGVPVSNPGRCTFRCGLEQVTFTLLSTGWTQEAVDRWPTWTDCDKAGDYVVPNVLSPRDLVFRPDNMDKTVPYTHVLPLDSFTVGQLLAPPGCHHLTSVVHLLQTICHQVP